MQDDADSRGPLALPASGGMLSLVAGYVGSGSVPVLFNLHQMRSKLSPAVALLLLACSHRAPTPSTPIAALDSVMLERTACFGTCPIYHLTITRPGTARMQVRALGTDTGPVAHVYELAPTVLDSIARRVARIDFLSYPDLIRSDPQLCGTLATDHPSLIISIFGQRVKRVNYYTGCYVSGSSPAAGGLAIAARLVDLAALGKAIDSLANTAKWVGRP